MCFCFDRVTSLWCQLVFIGAFVFNNFSSLNREEKIRWRCNIVESFEKLQKRRWYVSPNYHVRWKLVWKSFATKGNSSCVSTYSMKKISLGLQMTKYVQIWTLTYKCHFDPCASIGSGSDHQKQTSPKSGLQRLIPSNSDLWTLDFLEVDFFREWSSASNPSYFDLKLLFECSESKSILGFYMKF